MSRASQSAYPVATLRDNTESLGAAVLVCLAKPGKKAVHRLRTTTRRIEAQLQLLSMLPNLPPHEKPSKKATRLLKKLRREAGKVRDLDVQRDLIRDEATKKRSGGNGNLLKESRQLRRQLKLQRDEEADKLINLLQQQRSKIPLVFEKLLDALAPAESFTVTEANLTQLIHDWYKQQAGTQPANSAPQDPDQLHDIRKKAKLARYLAESAPESAANARRLAASFEKLQQAGGEWHDWLLLAGIASTELGKSAQLPAQFQSHAARSLGLYKRRLRHKI